jgi:DNA-binding GntR family transcriptional regulator
MKEHKTTSPSKSRRTVKPAAAPSRKSKSAPRQSFTELAYQQIRAQILNNQMPAGFQATEQDIAELLKMSRTPIREALLRLSQEGLIEIWPRHGMRVKYISVNDLREIYEIITALESAAVGLAALRKVPAGKLGEMRASIAKMDAALAQDDLKRWADADGSFHQQLAEASGNRRLVEVVETYQGQAHRLRMMTLKLRPKPSNSNRDHEAVVEAIAKGDAKSAERIHREHRERSGAMLITLLEEYGITSL